MDGTPKPAATATPTAPPSVATLLPANPTPGPNGTIDVGHLKVEAGLYPEFRSAMMHTDAPGTDTAAMVKRLVDGPHDVNVTKLNVADAYTQPHQDGSATIGWNPKNMFVDGQGGKHSSAVVLGHELDHADQFTHNQAQYLSDRRTPDAAFDNKEEKRVIEGWERKTSQALGEGVRNDHHSGTFTPNRDVNSIEPVLHQTRDGHTAEVGPGYSQSGAITSINNGVVTQDIGHNKSVTYPLNELKAVTLPNEPKVGDNLNVTVSGHDVHAVIQTPTQQQQPQSVGQGR